jgi:hypothetical protein
MGWGLACYAELDYDMASYVCTVHYPSQAYVMAVIKARSCMQCTIYNYYSCHDTYLQYSTVQYPEVTCCCDVC